MHIEMDCFKSLLIVGINKNATVVNIYQLISIYSFFPCSWKSTLLDNSNKYLCCEMSVNSKQIKIKTVIGCHEKKKASLIKQA